MRDSKTYQICKAVSIQVLFGSFCSKQLLLKLPNEEWLKDSSSAMLGMAQNLNCHWCVLDETVEGKVLQLKNTTCNELKMVMSDEGTKPQLEFLKFFGEKF